tara:strand:- start:19 stop:342 length:324 start_codon:yes stop_codon:yes gene_type:complete
MKNYKALKSASKASVAKVKVIDQAKVDEVKDGDGVITTEAVVEQSHEELQVTTKVYDVSTGTELDDVVRDYDLSSVASEISQCKSEIKKIQDKQADWEELEKDLKAL